MNILLVGNKPSENKIDYKNYDMICQVNRMNNIMNIPKVDLWYCDLHPFFFDLPSCILKSKCDLSQTKILIPLEHQNNLLRFLNLYPSINAQNVEMCNVNNKMYTDIINGKQKEKNMLTSDVIFLLYLLDNYPNDTITLSYLDVYNRGQILSQQDTHKYTGHKNAVYDEETFLVNLIQNNKINYIKDN